MRVIFSFHDSRFLLALLITLLWAAPHLSAAAPANIQTDATAAAPEPLRIQDIQVRISGDADPKGALFKIAHALIRQKPGETASPDEILQSVKALKLSRRFSNIHVDTEPSSNGDILVFTLTPYRYIADIEIHGAAPLFNQDVLSAMTLYPGDPYTTDALSAQTPPVVARYKREGYIDPKVSIIRKDAQDIDGKDTLSVIIEKGPARHPHAFQFNGNDRIATITLKRKMKLWWIGWIPGGRFTRALLREDADRLVAHYRKKGFFDVKITPRTEISDDGQHVDIFMDIEEGTRFKVTFSGNKKFWDMTLKNDVALFKDGNRSNIGVRKTLQTIRRRYHNAGFLGAHVKSEIHPLPDTPENAKELRFVIHEGPQSIVETVTVTGNASIPAEEIQKSMLTRPPGRILHDGAFVPEVLEDDLFSVTSLYQRSGFQERNVESRTAPPDPDNPRVAVELAITEGPRTTVHSISVEGLIDGVSGEAAEKALIHKHGDPFQESVLQEEKESITGLVAEKGYPHAVVETTVTFSADRTRADIVHQVKPGPAVTLGDIFISGNLRTRDPAIRRELGVEPGEPLSLRALNEGQRRLRDLDIFQEVGYRSPGLREQADTVHLFVDVREKSPYFSQFGVGYQSDTGMYGRASVGDRNLFGWNKALSLSGELSETGYRLETQLVEPRFLGTLTTAILSAYTEEEKPLNQTFGTRKTGGSLVFSKDLTQNLSGSMGFSLEQRKQFNKDDNVINEVDESVRTVFVTRPSLRYDSRDSFSRPRSGMFSSLGVDLSHGLTNTLDDFIRYEIDTRIYRTPIEGLTIAAMGRIGHILPYGGGDTVPDDQLFFLGGIQDIRGYSENTLRIDRFGDPVGGKLTLAGSLELRFDLGMDLELATFYDIGSVRDTIVDEGSDDFRSTVGLGLRYITPIGPIGIVYGHKLDREDDESAGRWHFSIGYTF